MTFSVSQPAENGCASFPCPTREAAYQKAKELIDGGAQSVSIKDLDTGEVIPDNVIRHTLAGIEWNRANW